MPYKAMADNEHSVLLPQFNELVRDNKIVSVLFGMNSLILHTVFGNVFGQLARASEK